MGNLRISVALKALLVLYQIQHIRSAPVDGKSGNGTTKVDGKYLVSLGVSMERPLIELFGKVILQTDEDLRKYVEDKTSNQLIETKLDDMFEKKVNSTVAAMIEKKVNSTVTALFAKKFNSTITTIFGDICEQNLCGDWTQWTACSGNTAGTYGATTRSRTCWKNRLRICQKDRAEERTEEETKVCKVCGDLPVITNGHLKLHDQVSNLALITCNNSYQATKDKIMCQTSGKWEEAHCQKVQKPIAPRDCLDHKVLGGTVDGIYNITLWDTSSVLQVFCDMTTAGGGWTVFQKRYDGSVDFYRNFSEYENGFGNIETEYWLGLKHIQQMASLGKTEMRIDLQAADNGTAFETFSAFYLSNGTEYRLQIGNTSASLNITSDDVRKYHNDRAFTTFDRDLDESGSNCAVTWQGAWWYNQCHKANLNGKYLTPGTRSDWKGMVYDSFKYGVSLKRSRMMLRRVN